MSSYINKAGVVSLLDVVKDGSLVEAGQIGHVLFLVELGRVHLLDVILGDELTLAGVDDLDLDLFPLVLLDGGTDETLGLVGNPDQPLLRPFCLGGGVIEGTLVYDQVLQVGVRPVNHVSHDEADSRRNIVEKINNNEGKAHFCLVLTITVSQLRLK